jgi:hypothetical protein
MSTVQSEGEEGQDAKDTKVSPSTSPGFEASGTIAEIVVIDGMSRDGKHNEETSVTPPFPSM